MEKVTPAVDASSVFDSAGSYVRPAAPDAVGVEALREHPVEQPREVPAVLRRPRRAAVLEQELVLRRPAHNLVAVIRKHERRAQRPFRLHVRRIGRPVSGARQYIKEIEIGAADGPVRQRPVC